jgi:hypothetical protein
MIKRSDLAFITAGDFDSKLFNHKDSVTLNAKKFTEEFGPFSIIMTTDLFHEAACHEVDRKYNPHFKSGNNT